MNQREDKLPKWVSLTIAVVVIFVIIDGVNYFITPKEQVTQAIGKFNDVKMDENIDNDAANWYGISPTIQTKDELKSGTIIVSDNGSTKTTGIFANGSKR